MKHPGLTTITAFTAIAILATGAAFAQSTTDYREDLVHGATHSVEIELNEDTVLCSAADYGMPFLKVLIPALAGITLLDHQNTGAGAPCVAAGACGFPGEATPDDIIDPAQPTVQVEIEVEAVRASTIDHLEKTCSVGLIERVRTTIRDVSFFHERYAPLGERPYSDCL